MTGFGMLTILKECKKIENIDEMKARHKIEIETLQKNCLHKKVSDWLEFYHDIGYIDYEARFCKICGKMLEKKSYGRSINIG